MRFQNAAKSDVLVLGLLLAASPAASAADACGKAVVMSGEECGKLVVRFDLTGCGDDVAGGEARIKCNKSSAKATLKTKRYSYKATLKNQGVWGSTSWAAGEVTRTKVASAAPARSTATESDAHGHASASSAAHGAHAPNATAATGSAAAAAAEAPAAQLVVPQPSAEGWSFAGSLDGYYAFNFNRPGPVAPLTAGVQPTPGNINLRYYDIYHNQFTLNLAEITVKRTGTEASFLVDLDFGTEADLNAASSAVSAGDGSTVSTVDELSKHVGQAYVSYAPKWAPQLRIDFGKMTTHVGYETLKAKENFQYSHSVLYAMAMPTWHTGLHVGYDVLPSKLSAGLYLYNGWNSIHDNNASKTFGAQLKYTPSEELSLVYNLLAGAEQARNTSNYKILNEVNAVYTVNSFVTLALDALVGQEDGVVADGTGKATWWGTTLHAKAQLAPWYYISPRLELYRDNQGYTLGGEAQTIYGLTLTNGFALSQGLETRLEYRIDHSTSGERFVNTGNANGFSPSQSTLTAAVIYSL